MGLLSLLQYGQLAPSAWTQLAGLQQPGAPAAAAQPSTPQDWTAFNQSTAQPPPSVTPQPQPRRMQPFQPAQMPQQQALSPAGTSPLASLNGAPTAQINPPSLMERINGLSDNGAFQIGLSLLGNAQNGGDWRQVGQDMQAFNARRQEQQRLANEERRQAAAEGRQATAFTRQQAEWGQQDQQRQRWEHAVQSEQDPQRRETLLAIGPEGYGTWLQNQQQLDYQRERARVQDSQFRQQLAQGYARMDQDRALNSASMTLGREEAQRLGGDIQRLRGWSMIDNDMAALEEILQRNPSAFNNLMDADAEQALARIRDPQTRRDVQTIYSIATSMAREELRGQTPVSNIDMLAAVRGAPSPSSGAAFARDWLNRAYQDRANLEQYVQGAINYMQQPDGSRRTLFDPDPATGRNFYQSPAFLRYTEDGRQNFSDVTSGSNRPGAAGRSSAADQQGAAEALRRRQASGGGSSAGTVGGVSGAPNLLRQPNAYEDTMVRQYSEALRSGNTERQRVLERRMRQRGLIP